jgi:EmrB/QacA subfamily drug resistance transporter
MANDERADSDEEAAARPAPAIGETAGVAWPLLLRDRITRRAHGSARFQWWVLCTVLLGLLSVNVTFTVFAVALPRIAREFDTSVNALIWVITGPMLGFGVFAPVLGKMGDLYGHRRLYLAGVCGSLVTTSLSAIAWDPGSLIAFRTLGAVIGAASGSASMALVFNHFDRDDRVKAMGWWSLVGAGGPVIGVAVGGPLIEAVGWRWIFVGQLPLQVAALGLAAAVLKEAERGRRHRLDWPGALLLGFGVSCLLLALNRGPEWGWTSAPVVGALVLGSVLLFAFTAVERRAPEPLLPLSVLRRRNFALPIGAALFANFAYMGGFILAPLLLHDVYGYGESKIGVFVIARPLTFSLAAPVAGYLAVKVGERTSALAGTLAVVVSMLAFAVVEPATTPLVALGALALSGLGLGGALPSISSSVANAVDEDQLGIASASQQLLTQVGVVSGIQVLSTVQAETGSFRAAYLAGAGVAALGVVCAALVRNRPRPGSPSASRATSSDAASERTTNRPVKRITSATGTSPNRPVR